MWILSLWNVIIDTECNVVFSIKYLILWLWLLLGFYSVHDRWMNVRMNKCMNERMCICGMMLTGENQCAWRKTCPVVSLSTTIPYASPGYRPGPTQWEARHCPPKASHSQSFGVGLCDAAFKAVLLNFVCVNYSILDVGSLPTFIVCILLGISPASNFGKPTFRNPVSVPSSRAGFDAREIPKRIHTIFKTRRKFEIKFPPSVGHTNTNKNVPTAYQAIHIYNALSKRQIQFVLQTSRSIHWPCFYVCVLCIQTAWHRCRGSCMYWKARTVQYGVRSNQQRIFGIITATVPSLIEITFSGRDELHIFCFNEETMYQQKSLVPV
jgi:hypothetical protein